MTYRELKVQKELRRYQASIMIPVLFLRTSAYRITDCLWKTTAQSNDRALLESILFPGKGSPAMTIKNARLKDEAISHKEMISILSYLDMFTAVSISLLDSVRSDRNDLEAMGLSAFGHFAMRHNKNRNLPVSR